MHTHLHTQTHRDRERLTFQDRNRLTHWLIHTCHLLKKEWDYFGDLPTIIIETALMLLLSKIKVSPDVLPVVGYGQCVSYRHVPIKHSVNHYSDSGRRWQLAFLDCPRQLVNTMVLMRLCLLVTLQISPNQPLWQFPSQFRIRFNLPISNHSRRIQGRPGEGPRYLSSLSTTGRLHFPPEATFNMIRASNQLFCNKSVFTSVVNGERVKDERGGVCRCVNGGKFQLNRTWVFNGWVKGVWETLLALM